jgi:hypothetical protein
LRYAIKHLDKEKRMFYMDMGKKKIKIVWQ